MCAIIQVNWNISAFQSEGYHVANKIPIKFHLHNDCCPMSDHETARHFISVKGSRQSILIW